MPHAYAEIAFTPRVRAEQARLGSDAAYAPMLAPGRDGGAELTAREAQFLAERDGFFQASVSETGWPYVQHRGGAPGFLKTLDPRTVAYADYSGNRQYISLGNLLQDGRVSILAVDFARRRRLKLLGRARISEDPAIVEALRGPDGPPAERAVVIHVEGFDWNCPQHIPRRLTDAEHGGEIARLQARVAELEARLAETSGRPA
ncbi:pyridoxamine 5'-phosphate oxidase family protein [Albimonas sp. CAU 1670]|uniref:pyridoxamine 5'-phosphate oxidase family protein n=1 Tax=Albimonas sp. CAU 1670 TaxID=3032599 RepID=UPI0023DC9C1A|nr:pyridoxamine 5'-phosphate oxidase family protein [Albimonas sp. CAU 1670]MDF2235083.1 pyridoxamine 5'-phosphate oxidase family protein [Albimonas sp. CAU 1670]